MERTHWSTDSAWALCLARLRRLRSTQSSDGLAHALGFGLQLVQIRLQLGDLLRARPEAPLETELLALTVAAATTSAAATTVVVAATGAVALLVVPWVATATAPAPVFLPLTVVPTALTRLLALLVAVALTAPAAATLVVMMTLAHSDRPPLAESAIFPPLGL